MLREQTSFNVLTVGDVAHEGQTQVLPAVLELSNPDLNREYAAAFAAVQRLDFSKQFAALDPKTADLRLLWIACGTEDGLIDRLLSAVN